MLPAGDQEALLPHPDILETIMFKRPKSTHEYKIQKCIMVIRYTIRNDKIIPVASIFNIRNNCDGSL